MSLAMVVIGMAEKSHSGIDLRARLFTVSPCDTIGTDVETKPFLIASSHTQAKGKTTRPTRWHVDELAVSAEKPGNEKVVYHTMPRSALIRSRTRPV